MENRINQWNKFDETKHLKSKMSLSEFNNLHSWDLGWGLLEQINIAGTNQQEIELSECFSSGQKMLYFFWYLDAQVTNGGFIQFYSNGYDKYLPAIIDGLNLIDDKSLIRLISKVDKYYFENQTEFKLRESTNDLEGIYSNLPKFNDFDNQYYETHKNSMELIENYARENITEFIEI